MINSYMYVCTLLICVIYIADKLKKEYEHKSVSVTTPMHWNWNKV